MWQRLRTPLIFAFAFLTFACATPDIDEGEVNRLRPNINQNTNLNIDPNANVADDNETELNSLIKLPYDPVENVFREEGTEDEGEKSLIAVLKFSEEDTEMLIERLTEEGQPFEANVDPETWFPAELIAKSQMSGDETIKGNGYSAERFYKDEYKNGSLTRITDTDYFVLILQTK